MTLLATARALGFTAILLATAAALGLGLATHAFEVSAPAPPRAADAMYPHPAANQETTDRAMNDVVFLHHSVGQNLIDQGGLRDLLAQRGYELYDQGYNADGLHLPDGSLATYALEVPDDNTDPDGLANIFTQRVDVGSLTSRGAPANALSGLLQHDVIVFKSCYPTTLITSDDQLAQYAAEYLQIRATVDRFPNKVFIAVTPPPLEPGATNPQAAARARVWANWLTSPAYLEGHPNLFVFDLYSLLAEPDQTRWDANTLRLGYRQQRTGVRFDLARLTVPLAEELGLGRTVTEAVALADSHPNLAANRAISPVLADAIVTASQVRRTQ